MKSAILKTQMIILAVSPIAVMAATPVNKIVMQGDAAPQVGAGVTFSFVEPHSVNTDGTFYFLPTLTGTGITGSNNSGAWTGTVSSGGATFAPALRAGDSADQELGTSGATFTSASTPAFLYPNGAVLEPGTLATGSGGVTTSNRSVLSLISSAGVKTKLERTGDATPFLANGTLSAINQVSGNSSGVFVFAPTFANNAGATPPITSTNNTGIVYGNTSNPAAATLILRSGTTLNMPSALTLKNVTSQGVTSTGRLFGSGNLTTGGSVTTSNDSFYYFSDGAGTVNMFEREGSQAPNVENGVTYVSIGGRATNGNNIAIQANLAGSSISFANTAIYAGDPTNLQTVLRGNAAAPGITPAAGFSQPLVQSLTGPDALNNLGHLVFHGSLIQNGGTGVTSSNDEAIWLGDQNHLSLVAREGDTISGTNLTFGDDALLHQTTVSMNNHDDLTFISQLAGPGIDPAVTTLGLFFYDPTTGLKLIAKDGDTLDIGGGDLRTIASGGLSNAYITDDNQLVFGGVFTDGKSGIFSVATPEPTMMCLAFAGVGALMRRRRNI